MNGILHRDVTEDRVRDHLRETGGDRYSDDEAGKAALDRDIASVMEAHRQRGQWLNSLDPLSRMKAEQQPFLVAPEPENSDDDTDVTDATDSRREHERDHHGHHGHDAP